jgi:hypothetical protein
MDVSHQIHIPTAFIPVEISQSTHWVWDRMRSQTYPDVPQCRYKVSAPVGNRSHVIRSVICLYFQLLLKKQYDSWQLPYIAPLSELGLFCVNIPCLFVWDVNCAGSHVTVCDVWRYSICHCVTQSLVLSGSVIIMQEFVYDYNIITQQNCRDYSACYQTLRTLPSGAL